MDSSVQALLDAMPDERRTAIEAVHQLIRKVLPDLDAKAWGKFIGYGEYHYRYASGREGTWFPVGLADNKANMALYVCLMNGDRHLPEALAGQLGKVSVGKSCVRFKRLSDLDLGGVEAMLQQVGRLMADGTAEFGQ